MTNVPLDPRVHPFRADIAASFLKGRVDAARYTDGTPRRVVVGVLDVRSAPDVIATRITQGLFGEIFIVHEEAGGWAWGQAQVDGYVGYVRADGLGDLDEVNHEVIALRSFAFVKPDIKTEAAVTLHMTSRVRVIERFGALCLTDAGGWVPAMHLAPIGKVEEDHVTVARRFVGAPYLWGGRSSLGVDCSALVQLALARTGRSAPRDSDQQETGLGRMVEGDITAACPGDLIFMPGHVGIISSPGCVLHANAHHMAVTEEPIDVLLERINSIDLAVTTVRRP